jgi:hypothetical protein
MMYWWYNERHDVIRVRWHKALTTSNEVIGGSTAVDLVPRVAADMKVIVEG